MTRLDDDALRIVLAEIEKHGNQRVADDIRQGRRILVLDRAKNIHLATPEAARLAESTTLPPDGIGEPWGRMQLTRWIPSLAAMVRIGAQSPRRRIVITDAAAQHFLYGKGVHKEGIVSRDPELRIGDEAWVVDRSGLVIGRGKLIEPAPRSLDVLKPLDDLGWYLREGG